jgi:hypothetical protein
VCAKAPVCGGSAVVAKYKLSGKEIYQDCKKRLSAFSRCIFAKQGINDLLLNNSLHLCSIGISQEMLFEF